MMSSTIRSGFCCATFSSACSPSSAVRPRSLPCPARSRGCGRCRSRRRRPGSCPWPPESPPCRVGCEHPRPRDPRTRPALHPASAARSNASTHDRVELPPASRHELVERLSRDTARADAAAPDGHALERVHHRQDARARRDLVAHEAARSTRCRPPTRGGRGPCRAPRPSARAAQHSALTSVALDLAARSSRVGRRRPRSRARRSSACRGRERWRRSRSTRLRPR